MSTRVSRRRGLAWVLLTLAGLGCRSVTPPTNLDAELSTQIDALLHQQLGNEPIAPGAAVMVIRGGEVVYAGGHGLADLESKRPITRETLFRLASVTKQFTCMAILRLAEEERLDLDDPALKYVPTLARFGEGVTIRRLMQHTSGLPEYYAEMGRLGYELPSADSDPLLTAVDATQLYGHWGELVFEPGERFLYSNPAYEQLGLIIEAVTGQSYGEYLRESILAPARMPTAVVRDRPDLVIPDRAIGYSPSEAGGYQELDDHPANWIVGAGGLYASLDDLYFWDRALVEHGVVSEETQAHAFRPAILNDGRPTSYGFGWTLGESQGRRWVGHGGAWVGFRTSILRFPDDGITVVVLANLSTVDAGSLARRVASFVLAEPDESGTEESRAPPES